MLLSINNRPVNGIEGSRHNGTPTFPLLTERPDWLMYYGMKACDSGGALVGEDPQFRNNRWVAGALEVRWRGIYFWLRTGIAPSTQMALFTKTVGELNLGEFVYLDWEEQGVTPREIELFEEMMNVEYPGRWAMYVNDQPGAMTSWLEANNAVLREDVGLFVPVIHPNYSDAGHAEASKWNAMIWQNGVGKVPTAFAATIPLNWCRMPFMLDNVCGYNMPMTVMHTR